MNKNDAIVRPVKGKNSPKLPPTVLVAATKPDLQHLRKVGGFAGRRAMEIFMSRLYLAEDGEFPYALAGPVLGGPYAAMLMETLVVWGARQIVFLGWCGAISRKVTVGDIIIPHAAYIDEGTSCHYGQSIGKCVLPPASRVLKTATELCERRGIEFHGGSVWSTDAIFRETPEKVQFYQKRRVMAVEMESSVLFSVARFLNIHTAALLIVSDELSSLEWRPGFRDENFKQGRIAACEMVTELCQIISK